MSEEMEELKFGRTPFDYKSILLIHLRNMSILLTSRMFIPAAVESTGSISSLISCNKQVIDENFYSSVEFLSQLVSPYWDEKFLDETNGLVEKYKDSKRNIRVFAIEKMGIITRLMDRLNLLLEKEDREKL